MFQPVGTGFQLVFFPAHQFGHEETHLALEDAKLSGCSMTDEVHSQRSISVLNEHAGIARHMLM